MAESTIQVRHARCRVVRGPMEAIAVTVPAYELPILRALYGDGNVVVEGETLVEVETPPEPALERERLRTRYGDHPDAGIPWVQMVFGADPARFEQELAAAVVAPEAGPAPEPEDGVEAPPLESFTREQLLDYLAGLGVSAPARATKAELLRMARAAEQAAAARAA